MFDSARVMLLRGASAALSVRIPCELAETEIVSMDSPSCSMMWQMRVDTCGTAAQPGGRLFFPSAMRVRTILSGHPCRSKLGL